MNEWINECDLGTKSPFNLISQKDGHFTLKDYNDRNIISYENHSRFVDWSLLNANNGKVRAFPIRALSL